MQWRLRSKRAPSGKLLKKNTKKKRYMRGRDFLPMHIGAKRARKKRARSGNTKLILLASDTANIISKGKSQKTKIVRVVKNPADPQFVRRNIITKGAIIQTELGEARVTSRPGQDGIVNAVLVEKKG
jgi:small subunit ribosomal protein S8e